MEGARLLRSRRMAFGTLLRPFGLRLVAFLALLVHGVARLAQLVAGGACLDLLALDIRGLCAVFRLPVVAFPTGRGLLMLLMRKHHGSLFPRGSLQFDGGGALVRRQSGGSRKQAEDDGNQQRQTVFLDHILLPLLYKNQ